MRQPHPRPLAAALARVSAELAPATSLARVQGVWREVAGEAVAAESEPVSERAGTVTVTCRSAVWAQELDLLEPDLRARLNEALSAPPDAPIVRSLRFSSGSPAEARGRPSRRSRNSG